MAAIRMLLTSMLVVFFAAELLAAESVTATGTVDAIDREARTITVRRETASGEKTATFKIADAAKILFDGAASELERFKPGQSVTIVYDTKAKQVTKLEMRTADSGAAAPRPVTADPATKPAPELIEVRELNPGMNPWLSEDGLMVHWERSGTIWTASRTDAESYLPTRKSSSQDATRL